MSDPQATLSRGERRKQRTRNALILASQQLFRAQGYDGVTVQDITNSADVGLGTFYNYFESKNEVLEAVKISLHLEFSAHLDELKASIKDPAMRFAITLRYALECIVKETDWAWYIVHTRPVGVDLMDENAKRILQEIQHAVDGGRFHVEDPLFALLLIHGMATSVAKFDQTSGIALNEETIQRAIHYALRMLGMNDNEALTLAKKPLPDRS